ncbi:MAG: ATP-grasp fold amidoligase family protein [Nitrospira sp.]|nr:ATP-grasp fold amidoligase family protein [Nitrospira sp.]
MEHVAQRRGITALRDNLWDTWIADQCRSVKRQVMRRSEGEVLLLRRYFQIHGKPLNLTNPRTFTEKLFWRMITWNRGDMPPRFTRLADKYAVRAHIASTVGEKYLTKLLWHGNDPRAIPFDLLPAEYVIKPSHAAEQVIIVKGHADRDEIVRTVSGWLASNYYWHGREYQYYGIKPRIVIEECLKDQDGNPPLDYKFYCFNGMPDQIIVRNHTHDIHPIFDTSWNLLDLVVSNCTVRPLVPKPVNLDEMLALAAKLSTGFGFVRVDLYNVRGHVYFGELTFTPAGGILKYTPESWDLKHGDKWDLSLDVKTRT